MVANTAAAAEELLVEPVATAGVVGSVGVAEGVEKVGVVAWVGRAEVTGQAGLLALAAQRLGLALVVIEPR
jgi:hypothetical protein